MTKSSPSIIPTRPSLLNRVKNLEDQESWKDFFDTYRKFIHGVAMKAGLTNTEAQEAVQETFITLQKQMPDFRYDPAIGSFKSWLLRTTYWRISDQFKKRKKFGPARREPTTQGRTATVERIPDPGEGGFARMWDGEWEKTIEEAALRRMKSRVKPAQYQLFDLYVTKKWPVAKVAATMGVSASGVYLTTHRLMSILKKEGRNLRAKME